MFPKMIEVLKPGTVGAAALKTVNVNKTMSEISAIRRDSYCPEGSYMSLRINNQLVMSDTDFEQKTNYKVVMKAKGAVLIAGLGLGMIILPIAKKSEVTSILVIEKSQDVIDLVQPQLMQALGDNAHKLKTICADIFEWKPPKGELWDVIYFDIWPDICTDNLKDIATLHRKFGKKYRIWMGSWVHDLLKHKKRQGY